MIKRMLTENLVLKGISVVLAFVIWLMVVNVSKPEISDSKSVSLEVKNQNIFDADSKTWSIDRTNVTVSYNVRSDMRSAITNSDFHAYADLSDYSITGSIPIYIEVLNGKESIIGDVQVRPSVAKITIENVQKKKFDVKSSTTGDPKSGYKVANVILSPESVYLIGPESEIGRISTVGVEIDTSGISTNQDGTAPLVYYDANGNVLSDIQGVSSNADEISYSVTVHKEKNINLLSSVTGSPAVGYQYESTTVSPDSVTLASTPGIIDTMTVFELPEIDLSGITESLNVTFNLSQLLPAGIELGDDQDPQINVLVRIEKLPNAAEPHGGNGAMNPGPGPDQQNTNGQSQPVYQESIHSVEHFDDTQRDNANNSETSDSAEESAESESSQINASDKSSSESNESTTDQSEKPSVSETISN